MQKQLLFILSFLLFISCNSVKNTQEAINKGNFDEAISLIVYKLQKDKTAKYNQSYIPLLEDSYQKIVSRDLKRIDFLQKEKNNENLEKIYNTYVNLSTTQNSIEALLPLHIIEEGRDATFAFNNYTNEILIARNQLSAYLYSKVKVLFSADTKLDYRKAFEDLEYIEKINPNYKDVRDLLNVAHEKGTNFVLVSIHNETQKVIPKRLEADLLNFETNGLDSFWMMYHVAKNSEIKYDLGLELNLHTIDVSPENVKEKEVIKKRDIKKGFKYLLDEKGNPVFDKDGNKVKVDKFVTIHCKLNYFTQFKSAKIVGQVRYLDLIDMKILQRHPIASEFIFEHEYANYTGNKSALDKNQLDLIRQQSVPFPTNEQMIFDLGEDLKEQFKTIITRNKFKGI